MDGELMFKCRDRRTMSVRSGGLVLAFIWKTNGVWHLGIDPVTLTANQLRQIADKIDELNGKDSADAGH